MNGTPPFTPRTRFYLAFLSALVQLIVPGLGFTSSARHPLPKGAGAAAPVLHFLQRVREAHPTDFNAMAAAMIRDIDKGEAGHLLQDAHWGYELKILLSHEALKQELRTQLEALKADQTTRRLPKPEPEERGIRPLLVKSDLPRDFDPGNFRMNWSPKGHPYWSFVERDTGKLIEREIDGSTFRRESAERDHLRDLYKGSSVWVSQDGRREFIRFKTKELNSNRSIIRFSIIERDTGRLMGELDFRTDGRLNDIEIKAENKFGVILKGHLSNSTPEAENENDTVVYSFSSQKTYPLQGSALDKTCFSTLPESSEFWRISGSNKGRDTRLQAELFRFDQGDQTIINSVHHFEAYSQSVGKLYPFRIPGETDRFAFLYEKTERKTWELRIADATGKTIRSTELPAKWINNLGYLSAQGIVAIHRQKGIGDWVIQFLDLKSLTLSQEITTPFGNGGEDAQYFFSPPNKHLYMIRKGEFLVREMKYLHELWTLDLAELIRQGVLQI